MSRQRINVDVLPGEVVLTITDLDVVPEAERIRMTFDREGWFVFVAAVMQACPFGVPPAL